MVTALVAIGAVCWLWACAIALAGEVGFWREVGGDFLDKSARVAFEVCNFAAAVMLTAAIGCHLSRG